MKKLFLLVLLPLNVFATQEIPHDQVLNVLLKTESRVAPCGMESRCFWTRHISVSTVKQRYCMAIPFSDLGKLGTTLYLPTFRYVTYGNMLQGTWGIFQTNAPVLTPQDIEWCKR